MTPPMLTRPIPQPRRQRRRKYYVLSVGLIVIVLAGYTAAVFLKPFSQLKPMAANDSLSITTQVGTLPWPSYGQGAFGLSDGTVIATKGDQVKVPMASTVKTLVALAVLEKHPLAVSEDGPTITMTQRDVDSYNRYVSIGGSVTPVAVGQRLTERDMLEALMLPSANNIAESLAIWAFGSVDNYLTYANEYLKRHNLSNTVAGGDASGYSDQSQSTTSDLVKLGALAMRNPALAGIVSQKTAQIPQVGTVRNYNSLLGMNGINGIKTGNNDGNGGVFVGSATVNVDGKSITLISALSGAPSLGRILNDSGTFLTAVQTTFANTTVVKAGTVLGTYRDTTGNNLQAVAARDITVKVLRGGSVKATINLRPAAYDAQAGTVVGSVNVAESQLSAAADAPIVLKQSASTPSLIYRLLHP